MGWVIGGLSCGGLRSVVQVNLVAAPAQLWLVTAGQESKDAYWNALLKGWEPYHMGWKKPWWLSVACPDDVDNEQEFRQGTSTILSI